MKKIIFTEDWQGYKVGHILSTRSEVADKIIKLKVAELHAHKKRKATKKED